MDPRTGRLDLVFGEKGNLQEFTHSTQDQTQHQPCITLGCSPFSRAKNSAKPTVQWTTVLLPHEAPGYLKHTPTVSSSYSVSPRQDHLAPPPLSQATSHHRPPTSSLLRTDYILAFGVKYYLFSQHKTPPHLGLHRYKPY